MSRGNDAVIDAVVARRRAGRAWRRPGTRRGPGGASPSSSGRPAVGGLAGSFDVAGVRVDHGSHRLHERTDPDAARRPPRACSATSCSTVRATGASGSAAAGWRSRCARPTCVTQAPPAFAARAARDLAAGAGAAAGAAPTRSPRACAAGLGPAVAEAFYEPYARKLFGVPADELSGELFRRRVGARSGGGVLRRVLSRGAPPGLLVPGGRVRPHRRGDRRRSGDAGATVLTGVAATAVRPGAGRGRPSSSPTGPRCAPGAVLSTLPAAVTTALYGAARRRRDARRRRTRSRTASALLVYLVVPAGRTPTFDAHYFPERDVPMARLSGAGELPRLGRPTRPTAPCCAPSCPGSPDDDVVVARRRRARPARRRRARRRGPARPDADRRRRAPRRPRLPRVPPRPRRPPARARGVGRRRATSSSLFGRQPLFAHDNTHHALAMGRAAASCLGPGGVVRPRPAGRRYRAGVPRPRRRGLAGLRRRRRGVRGGRRRAASAEQARRTTTT